MKLRFDPNRIPILVGATAVGKTVRSLQWAQENNGAILSADSMQVYRRMDIGTAKVTLAEREKVPHFLVDIINPDEPWSLNHFLESARSILDSHNNVLIVGGTGLYIRALIQGFRMPPSNADPVLREQLYTRANVEGLLSLHQELSDIDPESAKSIRPSDAFRIIRALEIFRHTGQKASQIRQQVPEPNRFQLVVLNRPREVIYRNIETRVDEMIRLGLVDEVKSLLDAGYPPNLPALQGLGYKEIISYFQGRISLVDAIDLIKKRSRNFAKRQLTWYRSFSEAEWIEE